MSEDIAAGAILQKAAAFSDVDALDRVARHHALDDLIAAVNEYKSAYPLPVASKGFGWRRPEDQMPEVDVPLLLSRSGETFPGRWQRNETWLVVSFNTYETGLAPDAWTYIPECSW